MTTRRRLIVATLVAGATVPLVLVGTGGAADAAPPVRATGASIQLGWVETSLPRAESGEITTILLNQTDAGEPGAAALAWGEVRHWQCPAGITPPLTDPFTSACTLTSSDPYGSSTPLTLTVDGTRTAQVTGSLTLPAASGGETVPVHLTVTAAGNAIRDTATSTTTDPDTGVRTSIRKTTVIRSGTVSGSVGPYVVGDDPAETSRGRFSQWTTTTKAR